MKSQAPPLMRWDVLNELLGATAGRRYLEIGVQNGNCGARIGRAQNKTGVDPEPLGAARTRYTSFFAGPSDAFFEQLDPSARFDVVFVDGLHHAEQVLRDVDNALRHLAPDGFIVLHDCNPLSEPAQRVPRVTGVWNGDCWKAMVALRRRSDLDAFTIATDEGLGIVLPRPSEPLADVPDRLSWEALVRERETLLGLVRPSEWRERVGPPIGLGTVAVVSAIFDGRDEPRAVPHAHDVDDFVLFTDGDSGPGWTAIGYNGSPDGRLAARRIKTLALEAVAADTILWVDGRIRVQGMPLRPLLERALAGRAIAAYPHPWRRCAYDEAAECASLGLAEPAALDAQVGAYREVGFPRNAGLWNTMVVARRRTPAMVELGRRWWSEIERHTARDQVSLPFLLWQAGIECGELGRDVYEPGSSPYFERGKHAR